ncbi:MAG: hypothetical protein Q9212_003577 [Teloschistes hypoglaucus]
MSTMTSSSAILPPSLRLAQALGIMTSAFLSDEVLTFFAGGVLAVSYGFVPSMVQAHNTMLVRQWRTTYNRGVAAAPALTIVSTLSYVYLSYNLAFTLNQHKAEVYALAALVTGSIVPYTLMFMMKTNGKLYQKARDSKSLERVEEFDESKCKEGDNARELLAHWSRLNFTRGLFPLTGACLGFYASFYMTS